MIAKCDSMTDPMTDPLMKTKTMNMIMNVIMKKKWAQNCDVRAISHCGVFLSCLSLFFLLLAAYNPYTYSLRCYIRLRQRFFFSSSHHHPHHHHNHYKTGKAGFEWSKFKCWNKTFDLDGRNAEMQNCRILMNPLFQCNCNCGLFQSTFYIVPIWIWSRHIRAGWNYLINQLDLFIRFSRFLSLVLQFREPNQNRCFFIGKLSLWPPPPPSLCFGTTLQNVAVFS